jgi:hypothetical protein
MLDIRGNLMCKCYRLKSLLHMSLFVPLRLALSRDICKMDLHLLRLRNPLSHILGVHVLTEIYKAFLPLMRTKNDDMRVLCEKKSTALMEARKSQCLVTRDRDCTRPTRVEQETVSNIRRSKLFLSIFHVNPDR